MSVKKYHPPTQPLDTPPLETRLPLDRLVANYYRQSTDEQVGNISTTIQTVDMPVYLQRLGWDQSKIRMIDMDEGVSGTTRIDEREGMRLLFDLITSDQLGAVACKDEDRLFRDVTQIQVNIFIEACRAHKVLVITPSMIYDFAHPTYGSFHMRQFRFKSEMAADYIKTVILGLLDGARKRLALNGRWANAPMPVGFMVDMRKTLPGGIPNENYRKFAVFEPYAEVVREYFRIFLAHSGKLNDTLRQIWQNGPYFPDPNIYGPPDGYKVFYKIRKNKHGWCFETKPSLAQMLTNACYIGHWVVKNTVVHWHNHPPIMDEAIFYRAFNYLSSVDLDGTRNQHYRPNRTHAKSTKEEDRQESRPLCSGLMASLWEGEWKSVGTHWDGKDKHYNYAFYANDPFTTTIWHKRASYVDKAVTLLLLEKLQLTFDYESWSQALDVFVAEVEQQKQLKRKQLKHLETVMRNLITSLESINTPELIAKIEQRYKDAQAEYCRLQDELNTQVSAVVNAEKIKALQQSYHHALENWESMTAVEQRELLHTFITRIEVTQDENRVLTFVIYWQDGSADTMEVRRVGTTGTSWLPQDHELLLKLAESGASQVEIARAFPKRTWQSIFNKCRALTGRSLSWGFRSNPIKKIETYEDYMARVAPGETLNSDFEANS